MAIHPARRSSFPIPLLILLITACVRSSGGGVEDASPRRGEGGFSEPDVGVTWSAPGVDGGGGVAGTDGGGAAPALDAGPWSPSPACLTQASTLAAALTPAQRYGQMTQVDSDGLTVSQASSAYLGAVLSGGNSFPPSGNSASDWVSLVSSYLGVAQSFNPHIGMLYGSDAVHGNNHTQGATIFPHNIGLGATRDAGLVEQVERTTALEILAVGINWAFAPTLAAAQDIRWGRTYESFSESPDLAGELGAAAVLGLQNGRLGSSQSVLACAKHYAGDGATDGGVNAGNVTLDEATFRQLAIAPYVPAIAAGVGSIMVSYSSYQGQQMAGSQEWLTGVLKGELGFNGFLVSDWNAVNLLPGSYSDQVKTAINAGLDMVMISQTNGAPSAADFASTLETLVSSGAVSNDRIMDAVGRILSVKCEMGLLASDTTIDPALTAALGSSDHRAIARQAVRESLVLLKNDGLLPLASKPSRVHVTGSGADSLAKQCGGWTVAWQGPGTDGSSTDTTTGTTVLGAIKSRFAGTSTSVTSSSDGSGAAGADYAVVVVGEPPYAETQGDSTNPTLSDDDFAAIAKVKAAGVPFAVVLFSGRPLILTTSGGVSALDEANAFVAAWLPGTEGEGIVDVLFGDDKPTGQLSFTWPATLSQLPIHYGDGQTPLFPFGFGLSYP